MKLISGRTKSYSSSVIKTGSLRVNAVFKTRILLGSSFVGDVSEVVAIVVVDSVVVVASVLDVLKQHFCKL